MSWWSCTKASCPATVTERFSDSGITHPIFTSCWLPFTSFSIIVSACRNAKLRVNWREDLARATDSTLPEHISNWMLIRPMTSEHFRARHEMTTLLKSCRCGYDCPWVLAKRIRRMQFWDYQESRRDFSRDNSYEKKKLNRQIF